MRAAEAKWYEKYQRWQINVQTKGVRKTFRSGARGRKGKAECERAADDWLRVNRGKAIIPTRVYRVDELWEAFRKSKKNEVGEDQNLTIERNGRLYILPLLGGKRIDAVTKRDWQECINNAYAERHLAKKTLQNLRGVCVSFCKYVVEVEIMTQDRVPSGIIIPTSAKRGDKRALQPAGVKQLFDRTTYTIKGVQTECFEIHALRWAVASGCRPGETLGLRWEDVTPTSVTISRSINAHGTVTAGKNENAHRTILLTALQRKVLDDQRKWLKAHGVVSPWVFPGADGNETPYKRLYKVWKLMQRDMPGDDISLYELRHTMISISKCVPKPLLESVVGHSASMDTFGAYGHTIEGDAQLTADMIDAAFERVIGAQG